MKNFLKKLRTFGQRLAFWRKREPEALDLDQTLVIQKPGTAQLAPMPEAATATETEAVLAFPGKDNPTEDPPEATPGENAKPVLMQRLRALLRQKRVWIPAAGMLLLAIIGSVVMLIVQSAREKDALMVELQKAKQQLQQQARKAPPVVPKSEPSPVKPELSPEKNTVAESSVAIRPASKGTPPKSGECVINNKESVAESLKNCIEDFNSNDKPKSRKAR